MREHVNAKDVHDFADLILQLGSAEDVGVSIGAV